MTEALITVKGFQSINGQEDVIELKTIGRYEIKNDKIYIKYRETDEKGITTSTLIKVLENQVILTRSGGTDSRMIIEKGKQNSCFYSSFGAGLILDIYGRLIENKLSEDGGRLNLEYTLSMNSSPISENRIEITVKEV